MTSEFEIRLENVKMRAFHGVYDFERKQGNDFELDLIVRYDAPDDQQLSEDSLFYTISYVSLYEIVKEEMLRPRNLLETVAANIGNRVKASFPQTTFIECRIAKLHAPIPEFDGKAAVVFRFQNS